MATSKSESILRQLLELAEVQVNGSNPWDIPPQHAKFQIT